MARNMNRRQITALYERLSHDDELQGESGEPDRKAIGEINDIMNNTIDGWIPGPQHRFDRYGQQRSWVRVKPPDKADKADNEDRQLDLTDFTDCKDPDCPF